MSDSRKTLDKVDIFAQVKLLEEIVRSNRLLLEVFQRARLLELENYYIGAGCLTQTVWNHLCGFPLEYGVKDIDLVYFDREQMNDLEEDRVIRRANELFADIPIHIDTKNQARVHLWYEERFGYPIKPYTSLEDAITTWPTTATAIGMRMEQDQSLKLYAPFGLSDLFGMIVRPNKIQITKDIYETKVKRWKEKWPELIVIPWEC